MDDPTRAIRHLYRSEPRAFFDFAFRLLYPGETYQHNWHLDVIGAALRRCHDRTDTRLIINAPPRTLKSFCCSVAFPAWLLGIRPDSRVLCVTGHRALAEDQHALCLQLMEHPRCRSLFPHVRPEASNRDIRLPQGGTRTWSMPTGITKIQRNDVVIIDAPDRLDAVSTDSAGTPAAAWYERNVRNRLHDPSHGTVILVTHRVAEHDLTAQLLARDDGYELLSIPAIATSNETLPASLGSGPARGNGEALHPLRQAIPPLR